MSSGPKTQTVTNQTVLPKSQQANVDTLMGGALDLYNQGALGPTPFTQSGVAPVDPSQTLGRQLSTDFATSPEMQAAQAQANLAGASNAYWLDPNILAHPETMPGYANSAADITNRLNQNYTESLLPTINTEAVLSGDVGGSRQGVAQGLAAGRTSDAIASSLGQLLSSNYNTLVGRNAQAVSAAPSMFGLETQAGVAPGQILESTGGANRLDEQAKIDDLRRIQAEQDAARMGNISLFKDLTGGNYGGTSTQTQPSSSPSNLNSLIGLGLSLGSMFIPGMQPIGAMGMASSLGSLLGGMSTPGTAQWGQPIPAFSQGYGTTGG